MYWLGILLLAILLCVTRPELCEFDPDKVSIKELCIALICMCLWFLLWFKED